MRPRVMNERNEAKATTPRALSTWWPSAKATAIQSLAEPSAKAAASTITPINSVLVSVQADATVSVTEPGNESEPAGRSGAGRNRLVPQTTATEINAATDVTWMP